MLFFTELSTLCRFSVIGNSISSHRATACRKKEKENPTVIHKIQASTQHQHEKNNTRRAKMKKSNCYANTNQWFQLIPW